MDDQTPEEQMPLAQAAAAKYPLYLVDSVRIGSSSARRIIHRFRELLIMLDAYPDQYFTASMQPYNASQAVVTRVHRSLVELLKESEELSITHSFLALLTDAQISGPEAEEAALQSILSSSQALSPDQAVLTQKRAALALLDRLPGRGALKIEVEELSKLRNEIDTRESVLARDIIITEYQLMRLGYALDIQFRADGLVSERNPEKLMPFSQQLRRELRFVEEMRVLGNPKLRARLMAG